MSMCTPSRSLWTLLLPLALAWSLTACVEVVTKGGEDAAGEDEDGGVPTDAEPEDAGDEPDERDAGSRRDAGRRDAGRDAQLDAADDDGSTMDATVDDASEPEAGHCPQCPNGRCLADNTTCVECSEALPCTDSALKCDLASHTCVACLPSADSCPNGQYCAADFSCVEGCKNDESCASGDCNTSHECVSCLNDDECGAGRVCGTFECGGGCSGPGDPVCGAGRECCNNRCVDSKRDIAHCGGCGIACTATQFCGKSGCTQVAVSTMCETNAITIMLSGASSDLAESQLLAAALGVRCPAVQINTVRQDETTLLNPSNGRPLAGGNNVLVTLGSAASNKLTHFVEKQPISPLYLAVLFDATPQRFEIRKRQDEAVLLSGLVQDETPTSAHFVLQIVRDPDSGSLVVSAYGYWAEGTAAARWFLSEQVLGSLSSFDKGWYIYKWNDLGAAGPDAGDTFTPIASGT